MSGVLSAMCVLLLGITASARSVPDPANATEFFTTVADKLLRSTFSFGITNIPVSSNGVFTYTPAVHRLLQVAANVRDAATTNFYPTVYRPVFYRDASGNVFITGYQLVASVSGISDPQLAVPVDLTALPVGVSSNLNVYGVLWIVGAKKNLPNFNAFYSYNTVQVTRRLQFKRTQVEAYTAATASHFQTNQMLVMSITNHLGFSFWNSYTSNYPGGSPVVLVGDSVQTRLSCGAYAYGAMQSFAFATNVAAWPGSAWDKNVVPAARQAAPESFVTCRFDYPFVHEAALDLDASGNVVGTGFTTPVFNNNITSLPPFPPFELDTTNRIQAFVLDGSNVLDYVQFSGPNRVRFLADDLKDPDYLSGGSGYLFWSTNKNLSDLSYGILNQMTASKTGNVNSGLWQRPSNTPPALVGLVNEAKFFGAFFTGAGFAVGSQIYFNTNLIQLAPFSPFRRMTSPVVWGVNDPLVHYLASDLDFPPIGLVNQMWIDDTPNSSALPYPDLNSIAAASPFSQSYQPWGSGGRLNYITGDDRFNFHLALKDPLVWSSDDWNFPATNALPLTTLGRIHRGTPWQTIYLKATNILEYADASQINLAVGQTTWQTWTGDTNVADAALISPTNDWRLAGLLAALLNPNDATQLQSVNGALADWRKVLNGVSVLTNLTDIPSFSEPPSLNPFVMASNSPQAQAIALALQQAKLNRPAQSFNSSEEILATPELSIASPWLNFVGVVNGNDRLDFDLSDEAYEAIPSQLLPRLRLDSIGALRFTNGGWRAQFSGNDGWDYALQTSTNLIDWRTLNTNQPVAGKFSFPLAPEIVLPKQFYRSQLLP